jgi:hypothetical protein
LAPEDKKKRNWFRNRDPFVLVAHALDDTQSDATEKTTRNKVLMCDFRFSSVGARGILSPLPGVDLHQDFGGSVLQLPCRLARCRFLPSDGTSPFILAPSDTRQRRLARIAG